MKMTLLCAEREHEMNVMFEHMTDIANIDYDDGFITMYGTETGSGLLYYVILDQDASSTIRSMDGPNTILSTKEMFALGNAFGSFSVGEIDQGVHLVLPVYDTESGLMENEVFTDLCEQFLLINSTGAAEDVGMLYIEAIKKWAKDKGVDIL